MRGVRLLGSDESLKRFIRKLAAGRNVRNQTKHLGQDFPQTGQPIRSVEILKLGHIPKLFRFLE